MSSAAAPPAQCPRIRHLLTGTFNSPALHLLRFDSLTRALVLLAPLPARGPHQFLCVGRSAAAAPPHAVDRVYATTWAPVPELSSWALEWPLGAAAEPQLRLLNSVPITATSSYVSVQPPAFHSLTAPSFGVAPSGAASRFLYSAGGPTGESHALRPDGSIGERIEEIVFLKGGPSALRAADKTRKALRYGSHSIDTGVNGHTYVAHLGRDAILVYARDSTSGKLELLHEVPTPRKGDGPRHVVPSADGRWVYSVTEHTSYVDAFEVMPDGRLEYMQTVDILPEEHEDEREQYRGDTVRISPSGTSILATTRGKTPGVRGFVRAWALNPNSVVDDPKATVGGPIGALRATFETPSSGGKANAIEWAPRYPLMASAEEQRGVDGSGEHDLAVLTDDEQGHVLVLSWDGNDIKELARVTLPGRGDDGGPEGASHAVWLS